MISKYTKKQRVLAILGIILLVGLYLGKDLIPFLNDVDTLLKNYPALYPNNKNKLQTYQKARNDIIKIISNHTL